MSTFVCLGQCLLRRLCESRRGWSSHTQVRCAVSVTSSHQFWQGACSLTQVKIGGCFHGKASSSKGSCMDGGLNLTQILGNMVNKIKSS